ncbi:hypothetical protein MMC27_008598 [Xylographa pallens]|nr:hypothetical protein [Xylographa pallens]
MENVVMTNMHITYPTLRLEPNLPPLQADVEDGLGEAEEIYSTPPSTPPEKGTSEAQIGTYLLKEERKQSEDMLYLQEDTVKLPNPRSGEYTRTGGKNNNGPFSTEPFKAISSFCNVGFRQLYEISRFVTHTKTPFSSLPTSLKQDTNDYEQLWSTLVRSMPEGIVRPERSSHVAWDRAKVKPEEVIFSGDLSFIDNADKDKPFLQFKLKPLKLESSNKSNRLWRKFGGDRLLRLVIPELTSKHLPKCLEQNDIDFRKLFIAWLLADHRFLGRTWRAFWLKRPKKKNPNQVTHQVYLFAVDGSGFSGRSGLRPSASALGQRHKPVTIQELLEWFIPFEMNCEQPCLKLFARLAQAVSDTTATVFFKPNEIIRTSDAWSDSPNVRCLLTDRISADEGSFKHSEDAVRMNDGCARISRAAAKAISNKLGLGGSTPSIFQGRIAGAKGIWMIDSTGETINSINPDFWIEITESQSKFECYSNNPDCFMLTLDVNKYSTPLKPAKLNYQLIPILINRGVPSQVFEKLIEKDLTTRVQELEDATSSPFLLRKWIQERFSVTSQRRSHGSVEMIGGMPDLLAEKIIWFIEVRKKITSKDYCSLAIRKYCSDLEDRMKIELGRSASPYMIADPLAILEEGEVHLGFSSAFTDEKSGFSETFLNKIDILVARNPAYLPSDIQKVRAVFKLELSVYKDVIVFPSKGSCALADKLSGGDYDGDTAWVCWDPDLVKPFINVEPHPHPNPESYGMEKDVTKVSDIVGESNHISLFLEKGFSFNLENQMLGICTNFHESLCYSSQHPIDSPLTKNIGSLLGYLVDSAKAGLIFTEKMWQEYRAAHGLQKDLQKPAYKDKEKGRPTDHIIDRLVFNVAKGVSEKTLGKFWKNFKVSPCWDGDLAAVANTECDRSKNDATLMKTLTYLREELKDLHRLWQRNVSRQDDSFSPMVSSRPANTPFRVVVEQCRDRFLNMQPSESVTSDIVSRWRSKNGVYNSACLYNNDWALLKASTLFKHYHRGKFPWYVCGKELGELKLLARGGVRTMAEDLWIHYRLDTKAVKKLEEKEGGVRIGGFDGTDDEDGEEYEVGD